MSPLASADRLDLFLLCFIFGIRACLYLCLACWVVPIVHLRILFYEYIGVMFLVSLIRNNIKIRNEMSFLFFCVI